MPLLVLSHLISAVDSPIRQRGEQYARAGLVTLDTRGPESVSATVRGSETYQVDLFLDANTLLVACTCPYFDGELEVCKHIWATLITCVNKNVSFTNRVDRLIPDESALEGYADAWETRMPTSGARGNVVPIGREWVQPSRWRAQLGTVAVRSAWSDKVLPPPEITWVLDPQTSGANVAIEITSRSLKNNGELGKPKPLTIPRSAVASVASPLDREILAMLSSMYTYGSFETKLSIGWPLAEYLMPKLIATGRLLIRTGKGEYQPLSTFDGGEPWRLSVRCEDRGGTYTLAATLRRGEESRPLKDALAITAGGLVIFPNAITRFADDGTQPWAELLRRDEVSIPPAELDQFVKAIASSSTTIRIDFPAAVAWEERRVPLRATLELRDYGRGAIAGVPKFEYEGHAANSLEAPLVLADEKAKAIYVRDAAEETRKLDALWGQHFVRQGSVVTLQSSHLVQAIPKLVEAGWEVRNADGIYAPPGELELTVTSSIDWFDMNGTVSFGSERVKLPRLLTAMRKGEAVVRLEDGRLGMLREEWRTQLEPFLAAASDDQENGVRFRRNQVLLLDALLATRPDVSFDETFERARSRLLDVKITPGQPLESFKGTLRPYQSEGLGWFAFLRELGFGGCLADDMGLGKTIQVLALLDQRRHVEGEQRRPSLVVMPRSLVFNWKSESARFTPELRLLDHSTPDRIRDTGHFEQYDVVLTTYALLRKEAELFRDVEFDYVILDEAQAIKNADSQAAKAALLLNARHRLALSGTPVENHLGELASIFEFLNPGMLKARSSRVMKMLRHAGSKTPDAANARAMLSHAVRPFILRRTKAQVAPELPDRVEQTIWCELEPKQRKLYDELRDYYRASLLGRIAADGMARSKIHVLEALLRMRQAACHPGLVDGKRTGEASAKLDALFEELPILLDGGHKVLIFSQFTSFLAIVQEMLRNRGLDYTYIDGSTRDREAEVRRFQDSGVQLFLISLKAGGLGLNLTAAEYVFLLDPWWNPAVEAQAIDRAHRIGQTRNVIAYRLVARDTIEEKILQLQQSKRALADAIISEENSILRQLTAEDLDLLLS